MSGPRGRGRPPRLTQAEEHEVRRYREAGVSIERLAAMWHISRETVYKILARQRARFGLEQLPNGRRARAHLYMSKEPPGTSTER